MAARAGGGGAANACASRPGLIFCDSFEAATVGSTPSAAPWSTQIIGAGTVTIDGTQSTPGGQRSVHMNGGSNDYDTLLVLRSASILPTSSGRFYVRFFARFSRALATGHNSFLLADVFARQGQGNNFRFGEDGGFLEYTTLGDSNAAHATGVPIPPATWTCIEILLDHVKPEIDVWINGAEIADMHHTNYPLDNYDNLRFGFEKYAGPALEVWYDDIAVGTERIGCQWRGPDWTRTRPRPARPEPRPGLSPGLSPTRAAADPGSAFPRRRRAGTRGSCAPRPGTPRCGSGAGRSRASPRVCRAASRER